MYNKVFKNMEKYNLYNKRVKDKRNKNLYTRDNKG